MGFYPTREAVQKLIGFETKTQQPSQTQHYIVTVLLFAFITVLGISVRSLGKVYTLIGGFAGTCLSYVLPAAACLISRRYPSAIVSESTVKTPQTALLDDVLEEEIVETPIIIDDTVPKFGLLDFTALVLFVWGVVVMIFATAGSFK